MGGVEGEGKKREEEKGGEEEEGRGEKRRKINRDRRIEEVNLI